MQTLITSYGMLVIKSQRSRLNNIPLYVYSTFLLICSSINGYLSCFFVLAIGNNAHGCICQGLRGGVNEKLLFNGYRVSVLKNEHSYRDEW